MTIPGTIATPAELRSAKQHNIHPSQDLTARAAQLEVDVPAAGPMLKLDHRVRAHLGPSSP
jgi:hypothetical protein